MRLKKSSSYSPSLTAFSATSARIGLTEGGNFPLASHDSVKLISGYRVTMVAGSQTFRNDSLKLFKGGLEFRVEITLEVTVRVRETS